MLKMINLIENKKLSQLLGCPVGVLVEEGSIVIEKNGVLIDVTNDMLELCVLAVEDSQTLVLFNRQINITVYEVKNG